MSSHPPQYWLARYNKAGFSFFNTRSRQKKIVEAWTKYQFQHPTIDKIKQFLTLSSQNYAIVCGEISNLVVFDVDTKNGADPTPFLNRGLYEVRTPSGGYHFYTSYLPILASTKHKKDQHSGILKFVDVQSNGALVFCPPSAFPGPTGSIVPYTLVNDAPIVPLPDDLLTLVLDALEPEKGSTDVKPYRPIAAPEKGRPGDIFNALATWDDVLVPLGWTKVGKAHTGTQYWKRPGKNDDGISASTNYKGYNLFFAYTKHFDELQSLKGYTKFHLYAVLKFKGDFNAAARSLVMENYRLANNL